MPIKFRCTHCRQFLGISQTKAGEIVDCPTCGRTVRVPDLDGRVAPIPEPALNVADSSLADALHELARIGQPIDEQANQRQALEPDFTETDAAVPLPAPAPISLDPPLPAEPVALTLPEPAVNPLEHGQTSSSAAEPVWPETSGTLRSGEQEAGPPSPKDSDPLLSLSQQSSAPSRHTDSVHSRRPVSRLPVSRLTVAVVVVMSLTSFGLGYLIGRAGGDTAADTAHSGLTQHAGHREQPSAAVSGGEATEPSLKGRITYRTETGGSKPDRGARILVFPRERRGQAKLSIVGFRPADTTEDDSRVAAAGLRALGGDVAIADADGQFEVFLPQAGEYHILILSHYHPRDEQTLIEPRLKALLDGYFDRGEHLLGRVAYHFSQVRYQGEGTEPWDHTFR
jgi:hypothetical protein